MIAVFYTVPKSGLVFSSRYGAIARKELYVVQLMLRAPTEAGDRKHHVHEQRYHLRWATTDSVRESS